MLVSLAITLIMMGAVVSLFGLISDSVSGSRSIIELSEQLRSARNRLQADLQGATATMRPPLRPENDEGYFEIVEGADSDALYQGVRGPYAILGAATPSWYLPWGDVDDVLMFTVRARGERFVGRYNGTQVIESPIAEVAYFCAPTGQIVNAIGQDDSGNDLPQRLYTLYRRVLLVAPGLSTPPALAPDYYDNNDLSIHIEQTGPTTYIGVPNTLGDLTKRENRFAHHDQTTTFPPNFPFNLRANPPTWGSPLPTNNNALAPMDGDRTGDDVLLTNVLAFDVQVWDPEAPLFRVGSNVIEPRDNGYDQQLQQYVSGAVTPVASGAYADLGWGVARGVTPPTSFSITMPTKSGFGVTPPYVWDTWSLHYENNGIDDDMDVPPLIDEGMNGIDDDGINGVDDLGEYETLPPYSAPIRGIRITIRVFEPSSQQVRQMTVVQDFLPD